MSSFRCSRRPTTCGRARRWCRSSARRASTGPRRAPPSGSTGGSPTRSSDATCAMRWPRYELPVLATAITQRVVYAEAAVAGESVFERDPGGPAEAEIDSLRTDLEELASMSEEGEHRAQGRATRQAARAPRRQTSGSGLGARPPRRRQRQPSRRSASRSTSRRASTVASRSGARWKGRPSPPRSAGSSRNVFLPESNTNLDVGSSKDSTRSAQVVDRPSCKPLHSASISALASGRVREGQCG